MNGWFNTQSGLLQNKAIQDLAAINDASMFDYTIAGYIVSIGQPARGTELIKKAIEMGLQKKKEHDQFLYKVLRKIDGKLFGEKLDVSLSAEQREHDLASTYTSLGQVLFARKKVRRLGKHMRRQYSFLMTQVYPSKSSATKSPSSINFGLRPRQMQILTAIQPWRI